MQHGTLYTNNWHQCWKCLNKGGLETTLGRVQSCHSSEISVRSSVLVKLMCRPVPLVINVSFSLKVPPLCFKGDYVWCGKQNKLFGKYLNFCQLSYNAQTSAETGCVWFTAREILVKIMKIMFAWTCTAKHKKAAVVIVKLEIPIEQLGNHGGRVSNPWLKAAGRWCPL